MTRFFTAIQLIVGQGVTHNRIFLRKCAPWSKMWCLWFKLYLGIDNFKLAKAVWGKFYPTPDLLYRISQLHDRGRDPGTAAQFLAAIDPQQLMAACERLAVSQGRSRALRELEEAICRCLYQGKWRV